MSERGQAKVDSVVRWHIRAALKAIKRGASMESVAAQAHAALAPKSATLNLLRVQGDNVDAWAADAFLARLDKASRRDRRALLERMDSGDLKSLREAEQRRHPQAAHGKPSKLAAALEQAIVRHAELLAQLWSEVGMRLLQAGDLSLHDLVRPDGLLSTDMYTLLQLQRAIDTHDALLQSVDPALLKGLSSKGPAGSDGRPTDDKRLGDSSSGAQAQTLKSVSSRTRPGRSRRRWRTLSTACCKGGRSCMPSSRATWPNSPTPWASTPLPTNCASWRSLPRDPLTAERQGRPRANFSARAGTHRQHPFRPPPAAFHEPSIPG